MRVYYSAPEIPANPTKEHTMTIHTAAATREQATYLADSVALWGGRVGYADTAGIVAMDDRAYAILKDLKPDCDGHIDSHDRLWIGGTCVTVTKSDA